MRRSFLSDFQTEAAAVHADRAARVRELQAQGVPVAPAFREVIPRQAVYPPVVPNPAASPYTNVLSPPLPPAYSPLLDLQADLEAELSNFVQRYKYFADGDYPITVAANRTEIIARTVDPRAYFVANELQWGIDDAAGGPTDILVQLQAGNGDLVFREPIALTALPVTSVTTFGATPLPYEWILAPGDTFMIRLQNRSATSHVVAAFLSGYKVITD